MNTQTNVISTPSLYHFERRPQAGVEKSIPKRSFDSLHSLKMTGSAVISTITALIAGLLLASCEMDEATTSRGTQIDDGALQHLSLSIGSTRTSRNTVYCVMTEGNGVITEGLRATINTPSSFDQTEVVGVEPALVEEYNKINGTDYAAFPASYCTIANGGTIKIPAGEKYSDELRLTLSVVNSLGNNLPAGHYVLPIASLTTKDVVYYDITVRSPYEGDAGLYSGDDIMFVFYVNTTQYDPRLASDYYMTFVSHDWSETYAAIGNIINLRRTQISYDSVTGRAVFNLGPDMRYVLDHYTTYITPLQEEGRKVCISIEGAGSGLGFCNLTDAQIEDFVSQLKIAFDAYPLDGINLWDRNSGYDKSAENGFPEMNTTSYPKLIVALREMLGPDRMLTVTDYEEPTEYFYDTEKTGGIEVGKYIDYAWSGYCDATEGYHIVDPWHQGGTGVSTKHPRRPMVGLSPEKYGVINFPWYISLKSQELLDAWNNSYANALAWTNSGYQRNGILIFEDIRTNLQDSAETVWDGSFMEAGLFCVNYTMLRFDKTRLWTNYDGTYGKWLKDW